MKNELVSRLRRALAHEGDNTEISDLFENLMHSLVASLPPEYAGVYEGIVERMARAAEELGEDADIWDIHARAKELKRQPL
jgi:hypothetical protein